MSQNSIAGCDTQAIIISEFKLTFLQEVLIAAMVTIFFKFNCPEINSRKSEKKG
jgi:hypothetical protein